ncbi:hypothetical protein ES692_06145 [Psychroserpens burtonensis]|uniref:Uncharacterized protein n=1 Tax=Psychroserpens burtonensis TaxID=49278 RepID=A0A5C7BI28_9FLAO|nr:hypothetical protein [Psychroserpens burtonensis]TXE18622.1 hypothetical protein ES692_06145 [Psychroserpens burtonensis]
MKDLNMKVLYSDWCDTYGDDEHDKKITMYSKEDMEEFGEFIRDKFSKEKKCFCSGPKRSDLFLPSPDSLAFQKPSPPIPPKSRTINSSRPSFPLDRNQQDLWHKDFVKTFAFIGLILFVFGTLFLIVKTWQ